MFFELSFVFVTTNVPAPVELVITQFADQVRMKLFSQLMKGILRGL